MFRACCRLRYYLRLRCTTCNIIILLVLLSGSQVWIWCRRQQVNPETTDIDEFPMDHVKHGRERMAEHIAGLSAYSYQMRPVNCGQVFKGDKEEIKRSSKIGTNSKYYRKYFLQEFKSCKVIRESSKYIFNVSEEEKQFPIAFSILLYKDFFQVERLLRAIYRPSNIYCLHIDAKSSKSLHDNIRRLAACFDNVFIASKLEDVIYSGFSRLQADLNCMSDLLKTNISWKYFINLPGQTYPLRTNLELVKILKIYNGSNDIEGITGARMLTGRFKYVYKIADVKGKKTLENTYKKKLPPPHNISIVKGSAYGVFSRNFVKFVISDQRVQDFVKWLEDINSPDEYIWATLHHTKLNQHLNTPGGYKGDPDKKPWLATYAIWKGLAPCSGIWVRSICVFGVGDIPHLIQKKQLFVNKFYFNLQPVALNCMEEWYFHRVRSPLKLDLEYYRKLPFVNS
ncbi:beta-1,3-galactosyl-O-glycosyl-glycoprotein beta-1,6-N-acetylglucosaminyltransferase-like [Octopus vulgaris]|uniref:Beta-1,3-galactosyl-O-glycosyl-glycoprotein beta-1,6-N-acetylglucosaminyltransferase-like n=2 Tax=Octopus TaxID=6643 RepID=A0AA36FDP6_OCTVU|nr:beta-1,3-galactosyl-O-glycosyl-glycoprotein beta-1,6-N-acetylglucosaminyltransferase 3-like [Octopus sinensis]CAI9735261.1 beta-1,3-galactosyl-O-glycosyl-glycoprotein beta-1,6-N-acetylglucosaminyltransferase-like [Octopus vulgaris]